MRDETEETEAVKARRFVEVSSARQWWVLTWRTFLWFALPFTTLWGFGFDPVASIRVAAGVSACLLIAGSCVPIAFAALAYLVRETPK